MALKQTIETYEFLDTPEIRKNDVVNFLNQWGVKQKEIEFREIKGKIGVAITSEVPVPGCATGANNLMDLESAVRFVLEAAKAFGKGKCEFYDKKEYQKLLTLYGSLEHLKTLGSI